MSTATVADDSVDPHHPTKRAEGEQQREYLLVIDLPRRVHGLRMAGLQVPPRNHDIYLHIAESLQRLFAEAIRPSNAKLRVIEMQELSEEILTKAHSVAQGMGDSFIVSTCMEIAETAQGMTLHANRVIGIDAKDLGIATRPGCPSLVSQVEAAVRMARGRPIVLVEDGVFTGSTICHLMDRFTIAKASVEAVVLGFAFPEAQTRIAGLDKAPDIYTVETVNNPIDWMPDHDFFPYIPNCGRVVGVNLGGGVNLMYSSEGFPYSVPYLHGYCPGMKEWAGLHFLSDNQMKSLTYDLLDLDHQLFAAIEECNGYRMLKVRDLLKTRPRVALPCRIGEPLPEPDDESIKACLRTARDKCACN